MNVYSTIIGQSQQTNFPSGLPIAGISFFGNPSNSGQTIIAKSVVNVQIAIETKLGKITVSRQRGAANSTSLNRLPSYKRTERDTRIFEERTSITASDLNLPTLQENPTQPWTKEQRTLYYSFSEHKNHIRKMVGGIELMAWNTILYAKNDEFGYDFERDVSLTATPSNLWSAANGTPLKDIDLMIAKIGSLGDYTPNMIIMGAEVYAAFRSNTEIVNNSSTRSINLVGLGKGAGVLPQEFERYRMAGLNYVGDLISINGNVIAIFTYTKTYLNESGVISSYMDPKSVLIFSSQIPADRYFTATEILDDAENKRIASEILGIPEIDVNYNLPNSNMSEIIIPEMFDYGFYKESSSYLITTQSAPIFVVRNPNSSALLKNVVA